MVSNVALEVLLVIRMLVLTRCVYLRNFLVVKRVEQSPQASFGINLGYRTLRQNISCQLDLIRIRVTCMQ